MPATGEAGVDPQSLFYASKHYQRLRENNIAVHLYMDGGYAHSPFNRATMPGADVHVNSSFDEALVQLNGQLARQERAYHFIYVFSVDVASHHYGPGSPEFAAELERVFGELDRWYQHAVKSAGNTLILLFADHGAVEMDPASTVYLDKELPDLFVQGPKKEF